MSDNTKFRSKENMATESRDEWIPETPSLAKRFYKDIKINGLLYVMVIIPVAYFILIIAAFLWKNKKINLKC